MKFKTWSLLVDRKGTIWGEMLNHVLIIFVKYRDRI